MKKDAEVRLDAGTQKGRSQVQAAARAGMSERTARTYEQAGALPSQPNSRGPIARGRIPSPTTGRGSSASWSATRAASEDAVRAARARQPGQYQAVQLRTLQRHIQQWRALHGPGQEVYFAQVHPPAGWPSPTSRT